MIDGQFEAVLTIRYAVPPGQSPEDAGKQIHNAGAMIPLGLVRFVKSVSVQIVPAEPTGPKIV